MPASPQLLPPPSIIGVFLLHGLPSDDGAVLQNEANQPYRLAFMQNDEPDLTRTPVTSPDGIATSHF